MEEHECTVPGEIKAVKNIAKGNFSAAAAALCSMESMKSHIFVENTKLTMLQLEVVNYSKQPDNMLRVSSPNSVSTFGNSQYYQQLCRMCPQLVCLLAAICKSGKPTTLKKNPLSELGKCHVEPKLKNAICAAASVCLHQYNPKLSVYHYRNGLMLLHGGVKAASLDRFNRVSEIVHSYARKIWRKLRRESFEVDRGDKGKRVDDPFFWKRQSRGCSFSRKKV